MWDSPWGFSNGRVFYLDHFVILFTKSAERQPPTYRLQRLMQTLIVPILLFALGAAGLCVGLLVAGRLIGPRRSGRVKEMPYESGMDPIHDTRRRFDVRYHLVAIAFLIFDVELLFLYPWAVARTNPQGVESAIKAQVEQEFAPLGVSITAPAGAAPRNNEIVEQEVRSRILILFVSVMGFIGLIALGFIYDWRKGVFTWR